MEQIEVAHEALIQNWQRLDKWLDEDREYLLWRQSLLRNVDEWKENKKGPDTLLRGTLLKTASDWESRRSNDLGPDEKAYIAASRRRRRLNFFGFAAVTTLVIVSFAIWLMASRSNKKTFLTAGGHLGQASLHEQRSEYLQAIEDYTKALELSPDLPPAYLGRARVYYLQGGDENYRNAIKDYTDFINLVRDSMPHQELAVAYDGRGQAYLQVNELDNASKDFTKATELDPYFAMAWYDLGSLLAQQGNLDQAIANYTKSIERNNGFYSAYLGRGKAYVTRFKNSHREEDEKGAFEDFEQAKSLDANAAEPYLRIGLIHYERKNFKAAIDSYEQARGRDRDKYYAEVLNALGQAYVKNGQLDKAISSYKDAAGKGYIRADYNLGVAYKAKGEFDNAINSLQMFIDNSPDNSPDNSEAFLALGEAYALKGEQKNAIENYSKSINLKPQQGDAYFSRGESYFRIGDKEKAISDFLTFLKSSPTDQSRLYQTRQYLEQSDFKPPIDYVKIQLHYNKTMDEALLDTVKTALREKKFGKIQLLPGESELVGIRFFQNSFKTYAEDIRNTVKGVYELNKTPQDLRYSKFPDPKNKDAYGWIEIWLPPSRTAPTPTTPKP